MIDFIIFWVLSAIIAWTCRLQWQRRAVFWPSLIPNRHWWKRESHPGQFWFLLASYAVLTAVCFIIPIRAAFNL